MLLGGAHWFSKFDLKSGFWQLGIHPDERHKIAFCIPNAHYQWTVMPFGLKTAPSLFQQAITKIYSPMLSSMLIYIVDLLIFAKTDDEMQALLTQFFNLTNSYGVMISTKKSVMFQQSIDFLGLEFKDGQFKPGTHIAHELHRFLDTDLTVKQLQQYLGIVNYIRIFIPKIAQYIGVLTPLLRKQPPPWTQEHTTAIQKLKTICQDPPPLTIPTTGKRILQTDASDHCWSVILLEEHDGTTYCCGHESGFFKPSELHYHTTINELLAIKNGIRKFDFFLRPYQFEIQMDNSAFPKVLEYKNKMIPQPQILRLKDWFSQYQVTVKHIPGKENILADFLTREGAPTPQVCLFTPTSTYPLLYMMHPKKNASVHPITISAASPLISPTGSILVSHDQIKQYAHSHLLYYLHKHCLTKSYSDQQLEIMFHYGHPYCHIIHLTTITPEYHFIWYIWCLAHMYRIAFAFDPLSIHIHITNPKKQRSLIWSIL